MSLTEQELLADFAREFQALGALGLVEFSFSREQCFFLLGQLQLALRHPQNVGPSSEFAKQLAHQLEELVSISPALREVARRGWDYTPAESAVTDNP